MRRFITTIALVTCCLATRTALAQREAGRASPLRQPASAPTNGGVKEHSEPQSTDGVLALKNGQVMRGRITFSGDHYFVDRNGLQVGVRTTDVEVAAATLEEAYGKKKKAIDPTDFDRRLALAEWCMRQDLFGQCAVELAGCDELHANHPRVAELKRRLELILSAEKLAAENRKADASQPAATRNDKSTDDAPRNSDTVHGSASRDRENGGFGAISSDAAEVFVKSIQPMLINQCAAGGCHGGTNAKSTFILTRFDFRKTPSRAYTQRNLTAVLKYVDASAAGKSLLLTLPQQGHGTATEPIFQGKELGQYQALTNWVYQAAGNGRAAPRVKEPEQVVQPNGRKKPDASAASYDEPADSRGDDNPRTASPARNGQHAAGAAKPRGASAAAHDRPQLGARPHETAAPRGRKPAAPANPGGGKPDGKIPSGDSADSAAAPAGKGPKSNPSDTTNDAPAPLDPADFNRRYFPDETPKPATENRDDEIGDADPADR